MIIMDLQLPAGGVKYVQALGHHFAVFRGEDSKRAFITDAYCPHMGANLGGNSIEESWLEFRLEKWIEIPF